MRIAHIIKRCTNVLVAYCTHWRQMMNWSLQGGSSRALESTDTVFVDGVAGKVLFNPVHKMNESRYTCKAANDVGETTASGQLTVRGQ